jgi:hypothetical protein
MLRSGFVVVVVVGSSFVHSFILWRALLQDHDDANLPGYDDTLLPVATTYVQYMVAPRSFRHVVRCMYAWVNDALRDARNQPTHRTTPLELC